MKSSEIRQKFIDFFMQRGHQYVQSSSLIPQNDPTLLFANAGMNQFKDFLTGKSIAPYKRAVTVQKCVRAGGKHNDLENVGFTARHHTFFEMLGNFSFGDYFKEDAIKFAWQFLTEELKIAKEKLYVTIHYTDDEAFSIWNKTIGLSSDRIFKKDKDNFWEMGEFGPCGPCSEIFYDHGPAWATPNLQLKEGEDILNDEMRYVEIWNLVFMQFEKRSDGTFPLPSPCIDTGAGLERIAAALQGSYWNYDTDLFDPIIHKIEELTHKSYTDKKSQSSIRVIADHIRSASMLITDGVLPSNEGRGYVLRRIIRRAIRHLKDLNVNRPTLYKIVPTVFAVLGDTYKENKIGIETAEKFIEVEEKKFLETLEAGLKYLEQAIKQQTNQVLSGEMAFKLFDTYGLPIDLTEIILKEKGFSVNHHEFNLCMEKQKQLSKLSWKGQDQSGQSEIFYSIMDKWGTTTFLGYNQYEVEGTPLLAKETVSFKGENVSCLIFPTTPFYPESGGQVGDQGFIELNGKKIATIFATERPIDGGPIAHYSKDAEGLTINQSYSLKIDVKKRNLTARNHTATHLLQQALIDVVGGHIKQAGSHVSSDRLRFDFTHPEKVSSDDLRKVEKIVNEKIRSGLNVAIQFMDKDDAIKKGAMALFGEKYGDVVRTVSIENFSFELCGGTHVSNISEIALFTIISEGALSSGVRRIEAATSDLAIERLFERSQALKDLEIAFSLPFNKLSTHLSKLSADLKNSEKMIKDLEWQSQQKGLSSLFENPEKLSNNILFKGLFVDESSDLKKISDEFVSKYQNGIIVLISTKKGKSSILVRSASHLKIDCSKILSEILRPINGKGGGRQDMAQGSGDLIEDKETFTQNLKIIVQQYL